ncbi:cell wall hydrolase/autolysin [Gemmatirosa kalamazoonensis]|uniref:N-acetylmuramoyl-L-alanine amidase n=1 Tax=Gemmatirosa kalamazoonensis TaxID=861299 RepID=W0RLB2_9BACT|nr:N-acetylmuramoyl-L-alanine amidase [Gemmatirosa kalamazoonensis]AHG91120.1 cell wall hydrolase/autolysin [Gemmatirosa kalamazoonensis]
MIAPLLALLLAGAAQPTTPPRPIVVRPAPGVERSLPVEARGPSADRFVRADRLAQALGGTVGPAEDAPELVRLRVAGLTVDLAPEAPFARVEGEVVPLSTAPVRDGERVWIPLQLVTDVLPRAGHGLLYDEEHRELRTFTAVATAPEPTPKPQRQAPTPVTKAPESAPVPAPAAAKPMPEPAPTTRTAPPRRARGTHVVVVDAGHGGPDSGMHGSGVDEKDVTLGIARQLDAALRSRGVGVVMTRARDTLIALADRGRIANQQHGELFLSIHVNAANPSWKNAAAYRGFETYFLADAKSEDARQVASRENESVRFETAASSTGQDPLGFILSDMAQNEHQRESSRLATLVQRYLTKVHPGPSHGVKQAGFKVLIWASMPAVLVEVGFGTNADDAAFIASARGQRALASAIADATVEYLSRAERTGAGDGGTR